MTIRGLTRLPVKKNRSAKKRRPRRLARSTRRVLFTTLAAGVISSHITNPFNSTNIVVPTHAVGESNSGQIVIATLQKPVLISNTAVSDLAFAEQGIRILNNIYTGSPKAQGDTANEIIRSIHKLRFDPEKPYLISGDHFSILYIRSLGIFYNTLLDSRTALDTTDWKDRQEIYLKTTAYALDVFDQSKALSTSIVPLGNRYVTLLNFFTTPSDTMYSLLYALDVMQDDTTLTKLYPFSVSQNYPLETKNAARELLAAHRDTLIRQLTTYEDYVTDPSTGLIKKDIYLSSTKDSSMRRSAFYDNVVLWKTKQLAQKYGLEPSNSVALDALKSKIIATYWNSEQGYFREDVTENGKRNSSDWLIVQMTGFIDPNIAAERTYLDRSVAYIQANKLDQPLPLHYQLNNDLSNTYSVVASMAPSYSGQAIWSNWGNEYIKLLGTLGLIEQNATYVAEANKFIAAYEANIVRYHGYPEVYDNNGEIFSSKTYKSVRQTGWVVTFEQAKALVQDATLGLSAQNQTKVAPLTY